MEVLIRSDVDSVAAAAASMVLAGLRRATDEGRPACAERYEGHLHHAGGGVLGLATGSSPLGLYRRLAAAAASGALDVERLSGIALDEYVGLPAGHPQSYRATLEREVCDVVGLRRERLHVPDGNHRDLDSLVAAAAAYEETIAALGGVDVQILGIGANGHLGFNEPGSALTSRTRVKRLSDRTREDNARFFGSVDDVPTHCLTQGLGTILDARRLVLVATGDAKAPAIAEALEGPLTASCPGSVLQWHADAVVVLDEDAAHLLKNRSYYDASAAGLGG